MAANSTPGKEVSVVANRDQRNQARKKLDDFIATKMVTISTSYLMSKVQNISGFRVKETGQTPLLQRFQISPLERCNGLLTSVGPTIFGMTLKQPLHHDVTERQILSFQQGETELFRAYFKPYSQARLRRMYVSVPSTTGKKGQIPVGCVEWLKSTDIEKEALIINCINNKAFMVRVGQGCPIQICHKSENGTVAAAGMVRDSMCDKNLSYQIIFADDVTKTGTWETKILMLCFVVMMAITENEEDAIDQQNISDLNVGLILIFLLAIIGFWFGVRHF